MSNARCLAGLYIPCESEIFPLQSVKEQPYQRPIHNIHFLKANKLTKGQPMRRTKIVCTIGPATSSEEQLEKLIRVGMNVARLNFSHGTQDDHAQVIARLRAISARISSPIAILQDPQGP